jgi:two-component system CheB/CheR fusion protein
VLDSLVPKEVEVQTKAGAWYSLRIRPYRTLENVIEGAVITFVDITEMRKVRETLQESEALQRLAVVVRDSRDAITVQSLDGQTLTWNPGAEKLYGWSEAEALAMSVRDRIPMAMHREETDRTERLSRAELVEPYRTQRIAKDGRLVEVWITASALVTAAGAVYAIATNERGIDWMPPTADAGTGPGEEPDHG